MNIKHIKETLKEALSIIDRRMREPDKLGGIPTGFKRLDALLDGFQPSYIILGGRTHMGKSGLAKQFLTVSAQNGYPAHLINIEDGNYNTTLRLIAEQSGIALWKIRTGRLNEYEYKQLIHTMGNLAELNITFDDVSVSVDEVRKSAEEAVKNGAKLVIIDYLQLIHIPNMRRLDELRAISRMIKFLCKPANLNIPIVVLAQLSRALESREDKRPLLPDLRECGDIEQDADIVMFLYRDSYYTHKREDKSAELLIRKGRNIGTGKIYLTFDDLTVTFREG